MDRQADITRLCTKADFCPSHEGRSDALAEMMDIAFDDADPRSRQARDYFRSRGVALTGATFTTRTGRAAA